MSKSRRSFLAGLVSALGMVALVAIFAPAGIAQEQPQKKPAQATGGEKIFLDNNCNRCHSVSSLNIQAKKKPTGEHPPPDLSTVKHLEPSWIEAFLHKQEKLDGRHHPIKFKGSAEELHTLANWISGLSKK